MSPTAKPAHLSVAVIVRDDAEALRETLQSVEPFASQTVVMDTGSTDDSRNVAKDANAELYEHPWSDSFAAARNACLAHVTGDWVLWLDAGETMSAEDFTALQQWLSEAADAKTAYTLAIVVPPATPQAAAEHVARVRLVPNHRGLQFSGRVRETLEPALASAEIETDALRFRIHRGSREHVPQRKQRQAERNLRLADLEIRESTPHTHLLSCMGEALQVLGNRQRASECFRHALQLASPGSLDALEAYYGLLTSMDGDVKNLPAQLSTLR